MNAKGRVAVNESVIFDSSGSKAMSAKAPSHMGKAVFVYRTFFQIKTAKEQSVSGPVYEFAGRRLLYSKIRPYLNKLSRVDFEGYCSSDMYPLAIDNAKAMDTSVAYYMLSARFDESIRGSYERASIPKINREQLFSTKIPLP